VLGYALVAFGGLGFFGLMFSTLGGLRWLPSTVAWPVGSVHGSLTMPDGTHVVPVQIAGQKIQIYGPDWRYVRGWYVAAGGGRRFLLQLAGTNSVEVITKPHSMRYVYDLDGRLLLSQSYAPTNFADFSGSGEKVRVPTPWWLWMFTSPMHSWLVFMLGGILLFLENLSAKRGAHPGAAPNGGPTSTSGSSRAAEGRHR